jgi:2-polyprenyl-6-hydroxyphenyl methylase/3-demethylubiquinone-9 3-methyltransferase
MLHKLNPVRLGFIREAIDAHGHSDSRGLKPLAGQISSERRPLAGRRALDVGCGAGLLCEPLARLGAEVTGVDAAEENINIARAHAKGSGLSIEYRWGDVGQLGLADCDLVCAMEVIEHVADKAAFLSALAGAMKPDGLMVLSTPNRTLQSRLLLVEGAERLGAIPRGTHHWADFITPEELGELLGGAGLAMGELKGIAWSPAKGLHLSDNLALNYIVTATAA